MAAASLVPACPGSGQIQSGYLRGLKDLVQGLGGRPEEFLERHRLDSNAFEQAEYHINALAAVRLLDECSSSFNDMYFGLRLAEHQDPDALGYVAALARSAPDFETALQCLVTYMPILNAPDGELELAKTGRSAELRWHSSSDLSEQANHHGLLLLIKTLKMLAGRDFRPSYATLLASAAPGRREAIERRIGCRIGKGQANAIGFPAAWLGSAIPARNRMVHQVLLAQIATIRGTQARPLTQRVEAFIAGALAGGACTMAACAAQLRIPPRSLQRRLAEEGQNFSALVEKCRIAQARAMLDRRAEGLANIALSLGYFDQTSFCRAFKRWTGQSPQNYRRRATGASWICN